MPDIFNLKPEDHWKPDQLEMSVRVEIDARKYPARCLFTVTPSRQSIFREPKQEKPAGDR
ncbi:MAG TPA: hypothetical protein VFC46_06660 [Humisphaera sp.]|nr:hypothetical protein [Humisphaera sp.]